MLGQLLRDRDEVVVLIAERVAARKDLHFRHLAQFGFDLLHPLQRRLAVDFRAARQQRAAEFRLIVDENHARARQARRMRRRQPRRPAADHQHVAMREALVVAIGVEMLGRLAETRCIADHFFVLRPELARPHERLVVEARRNEARELLVDRHAIVLDVRLRVHARRDESLIQLDFRRARIRHRVRAGFELHDCIRLFDTRRHDAARPVILPAARDEVLRRSRAARRRAYRPDSPDTCGR